MKLKWMVGLVLLMMAMTACDDTTDSIGTSLTDNLDNLKISTDSFRVSTRSIMADSVFSRNTTGYLGRVKDPETGAYITGNFMVQFHTLEGFGLNSMPERENVASLSESGEIIADSCDIRLYFDDYYGDSLATMKMTIHEMAEPMKEGMKYYSNYNPGTHGLLREDGVRSDMMYSLDNQNYSDSIRALSSYSKHIRVLLNEPYTDKDGKTYNNYGSYILNQYYSHPEYFSNSYQFINHVNPGFYFEIKDGLGSMAYIQTTNLNIFFRYKAHIETETEEKDTIYSGSTMVSGTEEVLQTTTVENDKEVLQRLVADNSCTYLKTPAGIFTEMTIPVDEITNQHENDTLSSAKVELRRINNEHQSDYSLDVPTSLLMVQCDSLYTFFEQGKVPDYKQSFLATNSSATLSNKYTFDNISNLVRLMKEQKEAGLKENPNWIEEHPRWNKVAIVPVTMSTYTQSNVTLVSRVSHDMSLRSTRLVGGSANPYDDVIISVIYSKFAH